MRGDGWEDYLEGPERNDLIKTARPQWMNLNVSDTSRLDEFFYHTRNEPLPKAENFRRRNFFPMMGLGAPRICF